MMAIPELSSLAVVAIILFASLRGSMYLLLLSAVPFTLLPTWEIGHVYVDYTDLIMGLLLLSLLSGRRSPRLTAQRKIPYLSIWVSLGLLMSLSYLTADVTKDYLTGPIPAVYQIYRYRLKPLLYFPLGIILLNRPRPLKAAAFVLTLTGFFVATGAIYRFYTTGNVATELIPNKNELGMILILPMAFSLTGLVTPTNRRYFVFSLATLLLTVRAVLFSGSRGGVVSVGVTAAFILGWIWLANPRLRLRLLRLAPMALLALVLLLAVKPDIAERPTIRLALTALEGSSDATMAWRLQERWPHFWLRALKRPWLGYGTAVDVDLEVTRANTPHNGYLALAVTHGFPAAAIVIFLALCTIRNGLCVFRKSEDLQVASFGLATAAVAVGVLVNSLVESTLSNLFMATCFWMLSGAVANGAHRLRHRQVGEEGT